MLPYKVCTYAHEGPAPFTCEAWPPVLPPESCKSGLSPLIGRHRGDSGPRPGNFSPELASEASVPMAPAPLCPALAPISAGN